MKNSRIGGQKVVYCTKPGKGAVAGSRIDRDFVKNLLPARNPEGHKGTFGKVLCVGGSVGYTGAPIFASRAAVRTGSGLVFLGVPKSI